MDTLTCTVSVNSSCGEIERCGVAAKSWISYCDNGIDNLIKELYDEAIRLTETKITDGTFDRNLTMIENFFISVYDEDEKVTLFSRLYSLHLPAGVIADFRRLRYSREFYFTIFFNNSEYYGFYHKSEKYWSNMTRKEIFELVNTYSPAKRKLLEVEKITIYPGEGYKETEIQLYPWERLGHYNNIISIEEPETKEEEIKPVPCSCGTSHSSQIYITNRKDGTYAIGIMCPNCGKKIETLLTGTAIAVINNENTKKQKEKIIRAWSVLNGEEKDN